MCIFEEIRDKGLIDLEREYPVPVKDLWNLSVSKDRIKFDPDLVKLFDDDMIRITLLHEEKHVQQREKHTKLLYYELIIVFIYWFPFNIINLQAMIPNFKNNAPNVIALLISFYLIYCLTVIFIGPLFLRGHYHNLEFEADDYATISLRENYSGKKVSVILKKTLETIRDYNQIKQKSTSFLKRIRKKIWRIRFNELHPSINERTERFL